MSRAKSAGQGDPYRTRYPLARSPPTEKANDTLYALLFKRNGITIAHTVTPLLGIAALWWKITTSVATKEDVNRIAENLQKPINQPVELTLDLTRDIREDMRQMRSEMQTFRANISKLNDKIDANSQTLQTKIDSLANKLRTEIREWRRGVDS